MHTTYLPTNYQEFIYTSRYAKWLEDEKRRETFPETVTRYTEYLKTKAPELANDIDTYVKPFILNLDVMPSMRALMTAGEALDRDNTCGYNCSFLPIDSIESFSEILFILMCGTGVGFSVERRYTEKLPVIPTLYDTWSEPQYVSGPVIVVEDSKEGWADALKELITQLYSGTIPERIDYSKLRPAGARLKTFGGRSSGPEPLKGLFEFVRKLFIKAQERQLTPLECHDIACKIGEIVVVGGVRRSALISLSDLDDEDFKTAKSTYRVLEKEFFNNENKSYVRLSYEDNGKTYQGTYPVNDYDKEQINNGSVGWWVVSPQRALANNSAVYEEKPDVSTFLGEWKSLYESFSGERGIFNRQASRIKVAESGRRVATFEFGTNPCSEIILRAYQFCNLTEVVVREDDNYVTLKDKIIAATILGTIQSKLTHFPYLRDIWKKNTEEERLLGVSLTGILDNPVMTRKNPELQHLLEALKFVAIRTNQDYAERLGIPQSTSITCVKPSGTVSQLVDSASGIHPRWSKYYIRRVRISTNDPICQMMKDYGVPNEADIVSPNTTVFSFPMKSPEEAVTRDDVSAVSQLALWKTYAKAWCEHKPSITVYIKPDEWLTVAAYVYENFDDISGISFLPYDSGLYRQAPYEEITQETYTKLIQEFPKDIDFSSLKYYESDDNTVGMQSMACSADSCEIVDLV